MKLTQNQFYGLKSDLPSLLKEGSVYLCSDTKEMYIYIEGDVPFKLVEGEKDVITRDELEEAIANIPGGGGGDVIIVVSNYSALPNPTTVPGKFYYVNESQGAKWLSGSLGGTYYPKGIYYSNGADWEFIETPYQSTQSEVNVGTNTDTFVTPKTLKDSTQWDTKRDLLTWEYLVANWSVEPSLNTAISGGDVYDYTLNGTTRYRFVPTTYNPTEDAFYESFTSGTLSGLITTRG